jgi:hypothetical protein
MQKHYQYQSPENRVNYVCLKQSRKTFSFVSYTVKGTRISDTLIVCLKGTYIYDANNQVVDRKHIF